MYPTNFNTRLNCAALGVVLFCCLAPAIAAPIRDVPKSSWAYSAVVEVTSKKIMAAPNGVFNGDRPVTRYELAVTLVNLINDIEQSRQPLHPSARPVSAKIPAKASPEVRGALQFLTAQNFIPDDFVLLKGTGVEPVTANQLATILGQVTLRISDRAMPPFKYTP